METKGNSIIRQNMDIVIVVLAAALILLVPLIAIQLSDDMVWTWFDFAAAATLLVGTGLLFVLAARKLRTTKHLVAVGIALAAVFLFVWAQLAVGVLGD
jgi:uncharacterized membrane protein